MTRIEELTATGISLVRAHQIVKDEKDMRRIYSKRLPRLHPITFEVIDPTALPNIARAIAEYEALPAERRAELDKDWNS